MRRTILLLTLGFLLNGNALADDERIAPDWTLQSVAGETITLSEAVSEQPVLLYFWATWCPYCKAVMPHIQDIQQEYGDDVRVLAIHFRDDKGDPVAFIKKAGYDFTLLPDGLEVAKLNGIWGTPGILIVDKDMTVRFDLYQLPKLDLSAAGEAPSHSQRAALLAPYWADAIRESLDAVIGESSK
ncbi:MAG: TlpA disulfide reductase family protein [Pseudomonadota bacterium]